MDPASNSGVLAQALSTIKDLPLWLLISVASALVIFLWWFGDQVSPEARPWVVFTTILFTVLAVGRLFSVVIAKIRVYHAEKESRRTFHLTLVGQQNFWAASKQLDGTMVTQISAHLLAKNRTDAPLYLSTVRLVRPRIPGEVINADVSIRAERSDLYGNAHISGHRIPPRGTLPIAVLILVRGMPKHQRDMTAVLAVADEEGNEQRVTLQLRCLAAHGQS